MAEKLRKPQQAIVGSKTRSAGRTPSRTRAAVTTRRCAACGGAAGRTIEVARIS